MKTFLIEVEFYRRGYKKAQDGRRNVFDVQAKSKIHAKVKLLKWLLPNYRVLKIKSLGVVKK